MQNPYEFDCQRIDKYVNNKRKYNFPIDVSRNSLEHTFKQKLVLDLSNTINDDKNKEITKRKNYHDQGNLKEGNLIIQKRMKTLHI